MEKKFKAYETKFKQLFEFFDDRNKYMENLIKLMDELHHDIAKDKKLRLKIDETFIRAVFELIKFDINKGEEFKKQFYTMVENVFSIKQYLYYFHSSKLNNFPEGYKLGYGIIKNWDSLPEEVKNECYRVMELNQSPYSVMNDEMWEKIATESKLIFNAPKKGQWLEIKIEDVSGPSTQEEAYRQAELSMDILRLVIFSGTVEPFSYTVCYDPKSHNVRIGGDISFTSAVDYFGDVQKRGYDKDINRLNKLVDNPSKIEKRVTQALNFLRIGDYISEKQNKIFYYAAGIEKIILGNEPELSYKFSLRGSFLLGADSIKRRIIFNDLNNIYHKRSEVAHGSIIKYDLRLTAKARNYLKNTIFELLKIIDENNIIDIEESNKGNTLVNYIEQKIFPESNQKVDQ